MKTTMSSPRFDGLAEPLQPMNELAPAPTTVAETGLSETFIADLTSKHLLEGGVLNLQQLSERIALIDKLLLEILHFLRSEARVEVLAGTDGSGPLRYSLTERGRRAALEAFARNGYVGAAPVPLQQYAKIVQAQTIHDGRVTRDQMRLAFTDVVVTESMLDQLGPSLNSGRAIFIYGPAGTGKTYIAQRLMRLFRDEVLIPHAIAVNESTIAVFDPVLHSPIIRRGAPELRYKQRHDQRWVRCERPVVITGGELTADMLDVQFEPLIREYRAPLQLKANNGIFIIDDMGRQRMAPDALFNRWIVPMEERFDHLNLGAGRHFTVPFDLVLVFSTNMNPNDLADEAFLRRIGYKIRFGPLERYQYAEIWEACCKEKGLVCDPQVFAFTVDQLHGKSGTPLLPCHPRDLLGIASDRLAYLDKPMVLTTEHMRWAWDNYFVSLGGAVSDQPDQRS